MNEGLLRDLRLNETDVEGALERLSNDDELYAQILAEFPNDQSMAVLDEALKNEVWDDAFTAVHALKGLAGNLGFIPLAHSLGELVILIRAGRICEIKAVYQRTKDYYDKIIAAITANLG